jgi:Ribosomal protein L6e
VNACPLRRVHQRYVIATSTRLDISKVKIPLRVNDVYFKRQKKQQPKKDEGEIFDVKKEVRFIGLLFAIQIIFYSMACLYFVNFVLRNNFTIILLITSSTNKYIVN